MTAEELQAALPALSKNITIQGPTGNPIEVRGSGGNAPVSYRVFTVNAGTTCEFENLIISNGFLTQGNGGGILNQGKLTLMNDDVTFNRVFGNGDGGGIYNDTGAQLNLYATVINGNSAYKGGGIYNDGTFLAAGMSQLEMNSASFDGGGLFNSLNGSATLIDNTVINDNSANNGDGGGVAMTGGNVSISGGQISGNSAAMGGGLYVYDGTLTLKGGVTIGQSNDATTGGGLYLGKYSTTTFNGCTISGNEAEYGVGYYYQTGANINPISLYNPDQAEQGN